MRLGQLEDQNQFVLRGGMLMRLWFRPLLRAVGDLDLVALFPFDLKEARRRFMPVLADRTINDGVAFDSERCRVDGIWLNTNFPAARIYAAGEVDGEEGDFTVDITFGEPLIPIPTLEEYPMLGCDLSTSLWMCRPETILGRKLHALMHMGRQHWRPKDLNDIRLLLREVPLEESELPQAIVASFMSREEPLEHARTVFRQDWWGMRMSAAKWFEFAQKRPELEVPANLETVVEGIATRLKPILESLPQGGTGF